MLFGEQMGSLFNEFTLFGGFVVGLAIYGFIVWFIVNKVIDLIDKARGKSK